MFTNKISASDIAQAVSLFYHSGRVPLFVGPPGIAKTAQVRIGAGLIGQLYPEDAPVEVCELHLASMSEVDVRGYLIPSGDQAIFTKPVFWASVEKHKRGILFLDEFAQATHEVQKAVAPLILERRIGEYQLPEGWRIIMAGNRTEDQAGANSLLSHVLNRLCLVEVTPPEADQWAMWAINAKLAPEIIAFAKLRPEVVFHSAVPDAADTPFCTPRSIHAVSDLAVAYPGGLRAMIDSEFGVALINGFIGAGATAELVAVVKTAMKLPTFEDVCANPDKIDVPTKLDEAYAMIMLCAVRANFTQHGDAPMRYVTRFPPNLALTGIVSMARGDINFLNSGAMVGWVGQNQQLLGKFKNHILLAKGK